jgi:copper chaperone NosL
MTNLSKSGIRLIAWYLPAMMLMLAILLVTGCGEQQSSPQSGKSIKVKTAGDITYGTDVCDWCAKPIETVRYGAELVTAEGTVLKFRAAEHLAAWMLAHPDQAGEARQVWVVDFADGKKMIGVRDALYLRSTLRPSPGGLHITPIDRENKRMLTNVYEAYPGTFMEWDELLALVAASGLMPATAAVAAMPSGNADTVSIRN